MDSNPLSGVPVDGLSPEAISIMAWQARTMPEVFAQAFPGAAALQLRERALAQLIDLILSGQLPLGEFASENKVTDLVSARLGQRISRTPVREALAILVHDGFVRQFPQRGFQVVQVSADETREVLSLDGDIEAVALGRLAADPQQNLALLQAAQNELARAVERHDRHGFMLAETDFHVGLALCAGLRDAPISISRWRQKVHLYSLTHFQQDGAMEMAGEEHDGLIGAIIARHSEMAIALNDRHTEHTMRWLGLAEETVPRAAEAAQPVLATASA